VGERREIAFTRLFSSWSKVDLADSLSHINNLEFSEDKNAAYHAASNSGADFDAADLKMIRMSGAGRSNIEDVGIRIVSQIANKEGVDGVLEAYARHPELVEFGASAVDRMGGRDWKDFGKKLERYREIGFVDFSRDSGVIGKGFSMRAPEIALGFLDRLEERQAKVNAAREMARAWVTYGKHHKRLRGLIEKLDSEELKDAVFIPLIEELRSKGRGSEVTVLKEFLL
jgi:hypothetical protein